MRVYKIHIDLLCMPEPVKRTQRLFPDTKRVLPSFSNGPDAGDLAIHTLFKHWRHLKHLNELCENEELIHEERNQLQIQHFNIISQGTISVRPPANFTLGYFYFFYWSSSYVQKGIEQSRALEKIINVSELHGQVCAGFFVEVDWNTELLKNTRI